MVAAGYDDRTGVWKGSRQRLRSTRHIVLFAANQQNRVADRSKFIGREQALRAPYAGGKSKEIIASLFAENAKLARHGVGDRRRVLCLQPLGDHLGPFRR